MRAMPRGASCASELLKIAVAMSFSPRWFSPKRTIGFDLSFVNTTEMTANVVLVRIGNADFAKTGTFSPNAVIASRIAANSGEERWRLCRESRALRRRHRMGCSCDVSRASGGKHQASDRGGRRSSFRLDATTVHIGTLSEPSARRRREGWLAVHPAFLVAQDAFIGRSGR
jgi:hypothetical protein